ncbi:MAG: stage II sporulation protein P, partial [Oscillibacter sp.]|nr:stage II sporulation protein P [Oscillibacter sp.]
MNVSARRGLPRQLLSALLSIGTLWTVSVTAGSPNAASAAQALRDAAARLEFGAPTVSGLSMSARLALSETPLLYSARDNAAIFPEAEPGDMPPEGVDAEAAEPGDNAEPEPVADADTAPEPVAPIPLQEAVQEPIPQVDNGIRARTLVPKSADGYTVSGRVYISSSRKQPLNVAELRETFDAELSGDGPQILILHSHGSEAYTPAPGTPLVWWGDSRTTDFRYSVVRVGDEMASVFESAGISVLHDRTLYDYPDYSGSYDRSLSAIESYLAQYPSIRFVLDVHRDYIADSAGNPYKVVSEIDGL